MPALLSLPLSLIVPVSVTISPAGTPGPTFNQGLIVGSSTQIPAATRAVLFTSLSAIATYGFSLTSPEYLAAQSYFSQQPTATYLWLGRQVLTGLQTIGVTSGNAGTGYVVGDIVTIASGGGTAKVTTIGGSGTVTGLSIVAQGSGYSIGTANATTGGSGSALEVDITLIGESPLQAIASCRVAVASWYACMFVGPTGVSVVATTGTASSASTALTVASGTSLAVGQFVVGTNIAQGTYLSAGSGTSWTLSQATAGSLSTTPLTFYAAATDSDTQAIAAYIEAATPASIFFFTTGEATVLNTPASNVLATLQALGYNRTFMMYSTTQSGAFPNNVYASAAVMGMVMGRNNGTAGSYFTAMFKSLAGVAPESLTVAQAEGIAGSPDGVSVPGLNGNLYSNWASSSYIFLWNGKMASGRFLDIQLFIDSLKSALQYSAMNLLTSAPAVPLTNQGIAQMKNALGVACQQSQAVGFIAPSGTWLGATIGTYSAGTPLPNGYAIYCARAGSLTLAQRTARQFPAMNVLIILAEAGQSIVIALDVQQ